MTDFTYEVERYHCYEDMDPRGSQEPCCHQMCDDLECVTPVKIINPRYIPERAGRYSGPPEDCYPPEAEEFEYDHDPAIELTKEEQELIEIEMRARYYEDRV